MAAWRRAALTSHWRTLTRNLALQRMDKYICYAYVVRGSVQFSLWLLCKMHLQRMDKYICYASVVLCNFHLQRVR